MCGDMGQYVKLTILL